MKEEVKKIGYVYLITSLKSNLSYVGIHQSESFDSSYFGSPISLRGKSLRKEYIDLWPIKNKSGYKIPSLEEFNKYFSLEILEWCESSEILHKRESFWISKLDTYKNGLNNNNGSGEKSVYGPSYMKFCSKCDEKTKWKNGECYNCVAKAVHKIKFCNVHNKETMHTGDTCISCAFLSYTEKVFCSQCNMETKHRGGTCQRCTNILSISLQECLIHGKTKFIGNICRKCISKENFSRIFCKSCDKETKHIGSKCLTCKAKNAQKIKFCKFHGLVDHRYNVCCKCNSNKGNSKKFCFNCEKETTHRGDSCLSCIPKKNNVKSFCSNCQKTSNHQNNKCSICGKIEKGENNESFI